MIWDDIICPFSTISYIYITSHKATKIWFDNFITELFSGNGKWRHGNFKIKAYLNDSGELNRCYSLCINATGQSLIGSMCRYIRDVSSHRVVYVSQKAKFKTGSSAGWSVEGDAKESQQWKYSQLESWMIIWSSCVYNSEIFLITLILQIKYSSRFDDTRVIISSE